MKFRSNSFVSNAKEKYYSQLGRYAQDEGVLVKSGLSRDYDMPVTDIIIRAKGKRGHYHHVVGENGQVFIPELR